MTYRLAVAIAITSAIVACASPSPERSAAARDEPFDALSAAALDTLAARLVDVSTRCVRITPTAEPRSSFPTFVLALDTSRTKRGRPPSAIGTYRRVWAYRDGVWRPSERMAWRADSADHISAEVDAGGVVGWSVDAGPPDSAGRRSVRIQGGSDTAPPHIPPPGTGAWQPTTCPAPR